MVLNHINHILHSVGVDTNEFELISEIIKVSALVQEVKDVYFERNIIVSEKLHEKELTI